MTTLFYSVMIVVPAAVLLASVVYTMKKHSEGQHVGDLALGPGGGLVDHDLRVGQGQALALGPGGQQERAHGGGHADADGGYVALDILHGVVNGHAGSDGAAGAIDVELDVLVGVLGLQIQQLGHNERGGGVVDLLRQHNDPVVQQPGKNVVRALAPVGLLYYIGN